jgi:Zn finger protein HypA/HybF involved in hydrogenase expression|tara:strand:+ start:111 stop:386 length:276 start_codon:yes stop_codon:yes gene_type:complete
MVRKIKNKKNQKQIQKDLDQKMGLFDELPEECLTCEEPFDRQNREQVMSWNVVVHKEAAIVRLYCPECWSKAKEVVKDFQKRVQEREQPHD